jgi:hypothetical protein
MANRLQNILWSIVCGTALGLGTAACYESDGPADARADSESDAEDTIDDIEDEESPSVDLYGAPEYGPPGP